MRFIRYHKVLTAIISLVFGCVVVTLAATPVVLQEAADLWIVSDALDTPADAIVVLGGGFDRRPHAAADLYKRGLGREIWITHAASAASSPKNVRSSPSTEELTRALLINLGVPEAAIVDVPGEASSTYKEAELVSNLIGATNIKSLIIPTDPLHTFRVKWTYKKLLSDKGIKVTVRPIFQHTNSLERWWKSPQDRNYFADEVVKYIYYRIRY